MASSSRRIVICFFSWEAYGFFFAFEKSYSLRIQPPLWIELFFSGSCLAGRNDPNDIAFLAIAMTHDQHPKRTAEAHENETILVLRVIGIVDQLCPLVREHRTGFLEAHAVLPGVRRSLARVPLETKVAHARV